ncbi:MAG: hypothetical protein U0Q15_01100 [Kineosporiaceae bacterium]
MTMFVVVGRGPGDSAFDAAQHSFVFMLILDRAAMTLGHARLVGDDQVPRAGVPPGPARGAGIGSTNVSYGLLLGLAVLQGTLASVWTTCSVYVVV